MLPATEDTEKSRRGEVTSLDGALALTDGPRLADSGEGMWLLNGLRKLKHTKALLFSL